MLRQTINNPGAFPNIVLIDVAETAPLFLDAAVHCYFLAAANRWPQLSSMSMFLLVTFYHSKSDACSDTRIHIYHPLQIHLSAYQGNIYVSRCAFYLEMTSPVFSKQHSKIVIHRQIVLWTSQMNVILLYNYYSIISSECEAHVSVWSTRQ